MDATIATPTVRLTVTDVFDQSAISVVKATTQVAAATPVPAAVAKPGLEYELF
jgi:hypothetical protein